ncbi:sigma-70 family RNA polymerase sigma factor [Gimesia benthica]|uniref:Sigma-70 family RNA polymerase sigma factor n=1 Tax=Gimesia benthica TaxID=2608982 RepID=A0A6I6A9L2_9PLAN|nr:sigma-70 family RNA polymerase sigma factor [Gimesia benthica]QGQ22262.1 sigma-70 family RNA polymerase sigma factor [Gimesia benthica]
MIVCSKDHCKQSSHQLAERARKILQAEIDFIPNPSFQDSDADELILGQPLPESKSEIPTAAFTKPGSRALSTQIARLCRSEVLSAADEQDLFRRMNYLKFKANMHRCKLDPEEVEPCELERIENLLQQAEQVRDQIFRSNMRLVVSIVKKCVTPGVSFDELLSDGCLTLMNAIEKFDYARGFRFSTYAYHSISNYAYRKIANRRKERNKFKQLGEERTLEELQEQKNPMMVRAVWDELSDLLKQTIDTLDQREQFIVRSRFALGKHRKIQTFQKLADELGISKERVRQLEQRAVAKLRALAEGSRLDAIRELVGG